MSAFSITSSYLETRFNEFNRKYFYSAIPMVRFKFSKTTRILGLYTHSTKSITITTAYDGKITSEEYDKEIEAKIKKSGCPQYYTNDLMSLIEPLLKELKKNGAAGAIYLMDESDPNNIKAKAYTLNDIEFIED